MKRRPKGVVDTTLERATLPASLVLEVGKSQLFDVGNDAAVLVSPAGFASGAMELGFVRVTGERIGRTTVFLTDRFGSRTIAVRVVAAARVPDAEVARNGAPTPKRRDLDPELRIRTGGALRLGSVGVDGGISAGQPQVFVSGSLGGTIASHSYGLSVLHRTWMAGDSVARAGDQWFSFGLRGPLLNANYGVSVGERPFLLASGSVPRRIAGLGLSLGPVDLSVEATGPFDARSVVVQPDTLRAEATVGDRGGVSFGVGAVGPVSDLSKPVPYARARLLGWGWLFDARVGTYAMHTGREGELFKAVDVASPNGPCFLRGRYVDAEGGALGMSGVTATRHSLDLSTGCRLGPASLTLQAVRSEQFANARLLGRIAPSFGLDFGVTKLTLSAWTSAAEDLSVVDPTYGLAVTQLLGPARLQLRTQVRDARGRLVFANAGDLFLGLGPASLRIGAVVNHDDVSIRNGLASSTLTLNLGGLSLDATWIGLAAGSLALQNMGQLGLTWRPAPAWRFSLRASVPFDRPRDATVLGGLLWTFGDDTPREPALSWLRSRTAAAEVFDDLDGNGEWGKGEPPLPEAEVCAQGRCAKTDASGRLELKDLDEVATQVTLELGTTGALVPTTPSATEVLIGSYSTPRVRFGLRRRVQVRIRTFIDVDGDGVMDHGEPPLRNVRVSGDHAPAPGSWDLPQGDEVVDLFSLGTHAFALDPATLPPGFLVGAAARRTLDVAAFAPATLTLGAVPLRSVSGVVCIDDDGDGKCTGREPTVEGATVACGDRIGVTDEQGRYLLPQVVAELCELTVGELELPAGVVQRAPPRVNVGTAPREHRDVSVPLVRDPTAKRATGVRFAWPKVGPAVVAELAGYTLDGKAFRASGLVADPSKLKAWKPAAADRVPLERALKLLKEKQTLLSVQLSLDPALPEAKAQADVDAMREALVRWLTSVAKVPADKVVTEVVPATGRGATVGLRVYQFFRRLKPDEVRAMEEERAREQEERRRQLDEARKAREAEDGSGRPPSTGAGEVPLRRLDVRVRMRAR